MRHWDAQWDMRRTSVALADLARVGIGAADRGRAGASIGWECHPVEPSQARHGCVLHDGWGAIVLCENSAGFPGVQKLREAVKSVLEWSACGDGHEVQPRPALWLAARGWRHTRFSGKGRALIGRRCEAECWPLECPASRIPSLASLGPASCCSWRISSICLLRLVKSSRR